VLPAAHHPSFLGAVDQRAADTTEGRLTCGFALGARGSEPLTSSVSRKARAVLLPASFAVQAVFELPQEFRLVPLGSVGSLTRC
jgi:hypothetical protein